MKHFIKIIALISALCLMLGMLSGCSGVEVTLIDYSDIVGDVENPNSLDNLENGVVAENEHFKMIWNKSCFDADNNEYYRAAIEFVSKKDGTVWSTTPKEYYDTADPGMLYSSALLNSSISIKVRNGEQTFDYNAYENSIVNGRFASVKHTDKNGVTDGITITYYFDALGIVVGVDYYLDGEGFKVSVDPKNVNSYVVVDPDANLKLHNAQIPGTVQKVMSVTPAPFLCGAQNTDANNKDSYFVIPSGSGALMYIDQRSDESVREFSGLVYGEDPTVDKYNNPQNETPITMPFYGIKKGNNALCAIIEQGSEACSIMAQAGDSTLGIDMFAAEPGNGYSYLAAEYNVLGYNTVYSNSWRLQYSDYTDQNITPLVIGYYPLTGDDANYTGMAKRYQKYLVDKENLKKTQDNTLLNVKLYGSYMQDELLVGIPYKKAVPLTTYDQATEILGELKKVSGGSLTATMQGFGEGGIDGNELAGGYKLTGVVGNKTDLKEFVEYTTSNGIKTFFNFDTINFYESGNGYSTNTDTALNINGIPAPVYTFLNSTRDRYTRTKGGKVGAMIARDQLADVTNDVVALADELGITGIAFNTLGNTCYSDYDTTEENELVYKYPWRNEMGNDVKEIITSVKENSKTVLIDGAYSYAAVGADIITNIPTSSNQSNAFDLDVPLYQIVFQGYRANSVSAINLANNQRKQFLKAIETGSGLSFELINNYDQELRKQRMRGLYAAYYQDNIKLIEEYVNEAKSFLTDVAGQTIVNHRYLTSDVTETVFDKGVTVYVNYGDTDYKIGDKVVAAQNFLSVKGGVLSE